MQLSRALGAAAVVAGIAACSSIAGLDGIAELACAPTCGELADGSPDGAGPGPDSPAGDEGRPGIDAGDGAPATDGKAPADAGGDGISLDGGCAVFLSEPFDDNSHGWTLGATWGIGSTCATPPAPTNGSPDPTVDHTTGKAGGVAGAYLCGNNPPGATSAATYLVSPMLDTAGAPSLRLRFYRWLNTDSATYMASTVDVYDGDGWINVYENPSGAGQLVTDTAWMPIEIDVSAMANAAFQVRFGYDVTSTDAYSMSLWNVDDLEISTATCPAL